MSRRSTMHDVLQTPVDSSQPPAGIMPSGRLANTAAPVRPVRSRQSCVWD